MKKIFLSILAITLLVTGCKKDKINEEENVNDSKSSNEVSNNTFSTEFVNQLQSYAPNPQNQTKNSNDLITFTTEKGNEIIFPARAFVDRSGNLVTGNVDISVTEITNISEMILSGMTTNSNQGPLSSQGEFNVEVSQNGQPLELAEGSTFTIENKNAEVDKEMKGWVWKENQTVGEAFENNLGEWVRNEFDENNPCDRMKSLWNAIENNSSNDPKNLWEDIKPLRDLVFTEVNKINALNDKEIEARIVYDSDSLGSLRVLHPNNYSDKWVLRDLVNDIRGDGPSEYNSFIEKPELFIDVTAKSCLILYHTNGTWQSHSIDPNAINITFSQLSWCNIDRLIAEYGRINSCKLKGNFPDYAQVKIVFKDLNGVLSCDFSDDGFIAKRLPEGYDLMFLVYFKDGDSIKFGTQTINAAEEMTFNEENLKTLTDMDALVEEIEKLVD